MSIRLVEIVQTGVETKDWMDAGYGFHRGEARPDLPIGVEGYVLDALSLDGEAAEAIAREAEGWIIEDQYESSTYNDIYERYSSSSSTTNHAVASCASYVIVKDGHFYGAVVRVGQTGGNGWTGSSTEGYCLLLTDGTVIGRNVKKYSFSGEDTDTEETNTYYLKKRES